MARITGVDLNDNWKVGFALTNIKGIGWSLADRILTEVKIDQSKRVKDLTTDELSHITTKLDEFTTEGDLLRLVRTNIQRLKAVSTYRGVRHNRGLPVRGQRTKSNARTKRGRRKTVGSFKKEALVKQQAQK